MGGNVFPTNIRLPKEQAESIGQEMVTFFKPAKNTLIEIIPSYRAKADYGDIDILADDAWRGTIMHHLLVHPNIIDHSVNGDVVSAAYEIGTGSTFQIDIIFVPYTSYHFSYNYFSYNDLGNFIGRFAHKMGLKFGHDGLRYVVRDGSAMLGEIVLTTDFSEALQFLAFDPTVFSKGFDTLEDIFEYVASNPRYYGDIYNLQHMSHNARVRDKKRQTYNKLLTWISQHPEKDTTFRFNEKHTYLDDTFDRFPKAKLQYEYLNKEWELRKQVREIFNGTVVSELTGLTGKELGTLMARMRSRMHNDTRILEWHENGTLHKKILDSFYKYRHDHWLALILSDVKQWDVLNKSSDASIVSFDIDTQCKIAKTHPELVKYLEWDKFDDRTKAFFLETYPEHCIIFI